MLEVIEVGLFQPLHGQTHRQRLDSLSQLIEVVDCVDGKACDIGATARNAEHQALMRKTGESFAERALADPEVARIVDFEKTRAGGYLAAENLVPQLKVGFL